MLRKPEAKFWQLLKKNLTRISWTRIETRTIQGFPDLVGCFPSCGFFTAELKVIYRNKLKITPHQIAWNLQHHLKGGRCFIIATTLEQSTIKIYGGDKGRELSQNVPQTEPLAVFDKPFDWQSVHETLTKRTLNVPKTEEGDPPSVSHETHTRRQRDSSGRHAKRTQNTITRKIFF